MWRQKPWMELEQAVPLFWDTVSVEIHINMLEMLSFFQTFFGGPVTLGGLAEYL
jgi:hypothetical protein